MYAQTNPKIQRFPTTMGNYASQDREIKKSFTAFYTDVLKNIRHHQQDYVFSMEQIEILQGRLKPNEEIIYLEDDGVFTIRLEIKGEIA